MMNRHLLVGFALILAGFTFYAVQRSSWDVDWWSTWWALLLLVMGMVRTISPGFHEGRPLSRRTGLWLMGIGAWGFISQARLFGFDYSNSWPLLVIVAGVNVVWRAIETPAVCARSREN